MPNEQACLFLKKLLGLDLYLSILIPLVHTNYLGQYTLLKSRIVNYGTFEFCYNKVGI